MYTSPIPTNSISLPYVFSSTYSTQDCPLGFWDPSLSWVFSYLLNPENFCQSLNAALSQGLGQLFFSVYTLFLDDCIQSHGLE